MPINGKQERAARFNRVVARRTGNIVRLLESLSNCSEKKNYHYNLKQVKKVFSTIDKAVKMSSLKFDLNPIKVSKTKLQKELKSLNEEI